MPREAEGEPPFPVDASAPVVGFEAAVVSAAHGFHSTMPTVSAAITPRAAGKIHRGCWPGTDEATAATTGGGGTGACWVGAFSEIAEGEPVAAAASAWAKSVQRGYRPAGFFDSA